MSNIPIHSTGINIHFTVGLPGVGKSTYIKNHKQISDLIVSRDAVRTMVYGEYNYRGEEEALIFAIASNSVGCMVYDKRNIWVDETGITLKTRNKWKEMLGMNINCNLVAIKTIYHVFPVLTLEQYVERRSNNLRGYTKEYWIKVISDMLKVYEPVTEAEGEIVKVSKEELGISE